MKRSEDSGPLFRALAGVVVLAGVLRAFRSPGQQARGVDPAVVAAGHERSDIRPVVILAALLLLGVTLGLVLFLVTLLETGFSGTAPGVSQPAPFAQALTPGPTPPAPRREAQSGEELAAYRAATDQKLHSYRWVDRSNGVVAIPIERAMDLVTQQGLPTRPEATAQAARDHGSALPSSASSGRVDEERTP
jgi:hypothetical protein